MRVLFGRTDNMALITCLHNVNLSGALLISYSNRGSSGAKMAFLQMANGHGHSPGLGHECNSALEREPQGEAQTHGDPPRSKENREDSFAFLHYKSESEKFPRFAELATFLLQVLCCSVSPLPAPGELLPTRNLVKKWRARIGQYIVRVAALTLTIILMLVKSIMIRLPSVSQRLCIIMPFL